MAYALPASALTDARLAVTDHGAILLSDGHANAVPLGWFFWQHHPRIYVPSGARPFPAVDPDVLFAALGAPSAGRLFFLPT
ncbi:MAG: hypothetical protein JJ992_09590, partial [Planctomycetes bacterium]|nr:hypothetical protein [Planctomycetota bacterium]